MRVDASPTCQDVVPLPANVLAVLRVSNEFLLRSIDGIVAMQGNDLIAALIFTALWLGNVRHITNSAANLEFGGLNDLPPDTLRRPVSVQTLANALGIPYETVRRHVQTMIRNGACIRVGKRGLIVPAAEHNRPERRKAFKESLPNLLRFLSDLSRAGFDFSPFRHTLGNTVPLPPAGEAPANIRALLRICMELILHGLEMIGRQHDNNFLTGMVYTAIWTANVRHVTCSGENVRHGGLHQYLPDVLRRPVTVNAVAVALRLPYETTRRYVSELVRAGRAVRIEGKGVIVPRAQFLQTDYHNGVRECYGRVLHTISELHRAGFDFRTY